MKKFVYFYEWSNINSTPKKLYHEQFFDAMREYGINVSDRESKFIQSHVVTFATCKQGKSELILSGDNFNLRKNYHKHLRKNAVR